MGNVYSLLVMLFVLLGPLANSGEASDGISDEDIHTTIERINGRYDDFFNRRHDIDQDREERQKSAGEIKVLRQAHREQLEKARAQYIKDRKIETPDPRLEQEWLDEQQARKEQNKIFDQRYVEKRNAAEAIRSRGRTIPPSLEYDIED